MNVNQEKYEKNFKKTFEIIDAVFKMKEAYLKKKYPDMTRDQIEKKIFNDILKRKERNEHF